MGRRCIVIGCLNHRQQSKDGSCIHAFPQQGSQIRGEWEEIANKYKRNVNYAYWGFCSHHFNHTDYNSKCLSKKKGLWSYARPSRRLGNEPLATNEFRAQNNTLRNHAPVLDEIVQENPPSAFHIQIRVENLVEEVQLERNLGDAPVVVQGRENTRRVAARLVSRAKTRGWKQNANVVSQNRKLKSKIKGIQEKLRQTQNKLYKKKAQLKDKNAEIKKMKNAQLSLLAAQHIDKLKITQQSMGGVLNPEQVKLGTGEQTRVCWSIETVTRAISLHAQLGTKNYNFLREKEKLPYPSISTLRRWVKGLDFCPGEIMDPVLKIMKDKFRDETPLTRIGSIGFDEVDICSDYCLDESKAREQIYGGKSKMLLVAVRGIFSEWKQAVYFDFSGEMGKDKILNIIHEVETKSGIRVVQMVNDMDPKNQRTWRELGVTIHKPYFHHPITNNKIFVMADYPHLLKLLKSHLVDDSFTIVDPISNEITEIKATCIEGILENQQDDLKICPKLTRKHLTATKKERQRVRPAFELFSNSVAEAIKELKTGDENVSNFFRTINNYSDLMNSSVAKNNNNNPYKSPYGYNLHIQNKLIDDVEKLFLNMWVGKSPKLPEKNDETCEMNDNDENHTLNTQTNGPKKRGRPKSNKPKPVKKPALKPFQKGFIINGRSLKLLLEELKKSDANIKFIVTRRLTQDYIEQTFGRFRGFGHGNIKPNAVDSIGRVKKLVICINSATTRNANVELMEDEKAGFLSASLITSLVEIAKSEKSPGVQNFESSSPTPADGLEQLDEVQYENMEDILNAEELTLSSLQSTSERSRAERSKNCGETYVAGFIARKFPTVEYLRNEKPDETNWLHHLSSTLVQPSDEWLLKFKMFEEIFNSFHKTENRKVPNINMKPKPIQSLFTIIHNKFGDIPRDVIMLYCKSRTIMRIKSVNRQIADEKNSRFQMYEKRKKTMIVRPPLILDTDD